MVVPSIRRTAARKACGHRSGGPSPEPDSRTRVLPRPFRRRPQEIQALDGYLSLQTLWAHDEAPMRTPPLVGEDAFR